LTWPHRPGYDATFGRITLLQHPERLHVDTTNLGRIAFALESVDGGFRETGTRLRVTVDFGTDGGDDIAPVAPVNVDQLTLDWMANLDQLEELLHGRPADWRAIAASGADSRSAPPDLGGDGPDAAPGRFPEVAN
ncbi:MAG: hypothetical protein M3Y46_10640, partial [Actinomycetota bacterium]|nr:hypothetical protein [Actinomycetota bacterium]